MVWNGRALNMQKNTRKIVFISLIIAIMMFGFSFALAPLYNTFCKVIGIQRLLTEKEFNEVADFNREVIIQFTTTNNKNVNWDFYPLTTRIVVHPGKNTEIIFFAKNNTAHKMTVQAIPSISPVPAISHFHKIQCFCFEQQRLNANEEKKMPVIFRIDRELPKEIHTITLAYTLFETRSAS